MKKNKIKTRASSKNEDSSFYVAHLDFRSLPELNDDRLFDFIKNLKGITMLDLNETEITNEAIEMIAKLEYVKELRMKGCVEIDDACISDLNKLRSLQFLHIKDTGITIDGLLQLTNLEDLTTMLFSDDNTSDLAPKMLQLKEIMPNCNFVVNGIPYQF